MPAPPDPKIYHITHERNLSSILADGCLWSDAEQARRRPGATVVGMAGIKRRRLQELAVSCHAGTTVGQYVPFYFCPRSVMLYVLHRGNASELDYLEGQHPIVHLRADLRKTVRWADSCGIPWAFTTANAGSRTTIDHDSDLGELHRIDWEAVAASDFRAPEVKEGKQAEFLLHGRFPWHLIEAIGVSCDATFERVRAQLAAGDVTAGAAPLVAIEPSWYY